MTIDRERRASLTAKYKLDQPPTADGNRTVDAILDSERITARSTGSPDNWLLCDPSRSPAMYAVVTKAHRELRAAMADGRVEYDTDHEDYQPYDYDPDDPDANDGKVLIHFVGSNRIQVCRRNELDEPWRVGQHPNPCTPTVVPTTSPTCWH